MFSRHVYGAQFDRVVKLYLVSKFVGALYFVYPIFYQFSSHTITPVEIGLFFSIISLCNFVTDIPTSILADKYSRKVITLVGAALLTIAPWLVLQAHSFSLFVVAAIFYGIGGACMNGAIEALMYDHKNVNKETFRRVNTLEITWGQAGILVSAAAGGMMFTASRAIPFVAQIIAGFVWLVILAYIQEQNKVDYAKSQASY
jgi:MFS family permease